MRIDQLGLDAGDARERLRALRHQLRHAAARGARAGAGARAGEGAQRHHRPEGRARPPRAPERIEPLARQLGLGPASPSSQYLRAMPAEATGTPLRRPTPSARRGDACSRGAVSRASGTASSDASRASARLRAAGADAARCARWSHARRVAARLPGRRPASSCGWRCRVRAGDHGLADRAAGAAAGRAPTSSTATAACWPPTSTPIRCLPIRARPRSSTRRSRSSPPCSPAWTPASCARMLGRPQPPLRVGARAAWRRAWRSRCTISACRASPSAASCKRAYPLGTLAGHVLGSVNIDNKGVAGIERTLDEIGRRRIRAGRQRCASARPCACRSTSACSTRWPRSSSRPRTRYEAPRPRPALVLDVTPARSSASALAARGRSGASRPTGSMRRCADRPDRRHVRARLGVQDADRRHGPRGRHRRPRQDLRRAPAADRRPLHHQGPASAGPAAHGARDLPALLQRRRRHAGAASRRRAPARFSAPARPARADAHGSRTGRARRSCRSTGARSRPSPSPTATAWPWRRCSSPPPPRPSSTAASR